jgi:hypothetical protein
MIRPVVLLAALAAAAACEPPPYDRLVVAPSAPCHHEPNRMLCACAVTADLGTLADDPEVAALDLRPIEPLDLGALARLSHLRALAVTSDRPFDPRGLGAVTQLQALTIPLPQGGLAALPYLPDLQKLDLRAAPEPGRPPARVDLTPLAALPSLRELAVRDVEVRDLGPLSALTKLERLTLHVARDTDPTPLLSLGALRSLELGGGPVRDRGKLASLASLDVLVLGSESRYGCASEERYERRLHGPLGPWLARPVSREDDDGCLANICRIDPSQCPVVTDCPEERRARERAGAR